MFALGWLMYSSTIRPLRGAPLSSTVLLTFGLALVFEAIMGLVWGNQSRSARPSYFDQSFDIAGIVLPKAQVFACAVAILVLTLLWLFLARTWTGRAIRAASANTQGAALVGVNIAGVSALTFAVGVATVGAAGSMVSVLYPFLPGSHYIWIARVLSIIVLGGLGSLQGRCGRRDAARPCRGLHPDLHLGRLGDRGALRADLRRPLLSPAGIVGHEAAGGRRPVNASAQTPSADRLAQALESKRSGAG